MVSLELCGLEERACGNVDLSSLYKEHEEIGSRGLGFGSGSLKLARRTWGKQTSGYEVMDRGRKEFSGVPQPMRAT